MYKRHLISSVHVGGAHERGLASDANVGVNSQHGDASVDGSLQSALSGTSIVGSADDGVAASADLLLDHGNLTLDIALSAGANHDHVNTQIITGGLAAGLHIAPVPVSYTHLANVLQSVTAALRLFFFHNS